MGFRNFAGLLAGGVLFGLLLSATGCESDCPESAETCPGNCPPIYGAIHEGPGTCLQPNVVISCKGRSVSKAAEPGCVRVKDPKDLTVYKLRSASEEYWLTLEGNVFESCPDNIRARAFGADTCDDWALSDAGADAEADAASDAAADASAGGAAGSGSGGNTSGGSSAGGTSAGGSSAGGSSAGGSGASGGSGGTGATGGSGGSAASGGGGAGATSGSGGATDAGADVSN